MSSALPLRGVVLAGGTGSRLLPLTEVSNKHLLPVGKEPMIFHPIRKLAEAGVVDVLVVTGAEHAGQVVAALGSGQELGCTITYRVQEEAGGIAQALGLAEDFAANGKVIVLLGDNVFQDPLRRHALAFLEQRSGARILLKEVEEPSRFGVPVFEEGRLVCIQEKPEAPQDRRCVTGIYFYDASVYDVIRGLRPSARGELEITEVNNHFIQRGDLTWDELEGWWTDAGTFESLARANALVQSSVADPAEPKSR
ncbi:MAG: spore coat protein [Deltaproteobacteria bacterium]|nr:spore coat protein [Deltaproteobacteria bacterium]